MISAQSIFGLMALPLVINGQNCDPGVCKGIAGLIYSEEDNRCAWADEVGCSVKDLGYDTDCSDLGLGEFKAIDFVLPDPAMDPDQYFVTCVKAATEEDRALEAQVKAMFPHLMNRGLLKPSGELTPRIMCCPNTCVFDNALKRCTGAMCPDYSGASPEPVSNAVDEDDPGKDAELI